MQKILFLFLIINTNHFIVFSQKTPPFYKQEKRNGLILGIDIGKIGYSYINDSHHLREISLQYRIKNKYFPSIELGTAKYSFEDKNFNYNSYSNGYYAKIGIDFNLYKKTSDIISFVTRIGFSSYDNKVKDILIKDRYWGNYTPDLPEQKSSALWLKIGFGTKVEIVENLYVGFVFSAKSLLNTFNKGLYQPYKIPGLGRADVSLSLGLNYSIYYAFGIGKITKRP